MTPLNELESSENQLATWLRASGLNQPEAAKRLKIHPSSISALKAEPPQRIRARMATSQKWEEIRQIIGLPRIIIGGRHIRAARSLLNWSNTDLAQHTHLSLPTIAGIQGDSNSFLESPQIVRPQSLIQITAAMIRHGIIFMHHQSQDPDIIYLSIALQSDAEGTCEKNIPTTKQ